MATFIDYNVSTFRDNSKPNKRRLQELQHTEARAHAARVAYWRKRRPGVGTRPKDKPHPAQDQTDSSLDDISVPTPTEQHDSSSGSRRISLEVSSDLSSGQKSLQELNHPGLMGRKASVDALTSKSLAHFQSSKYYELEDKPGQQFGDLSVFIRLTSHPKSLLFDPFDTLPSRQGEEVVTAMNHFIHHWAPSQKPGLKFQTKDNPLIRDVFPAALQNVELFEACVALCLSFRAAGSNFTTYLCNASIHHKCEALAGIRRRLISGQVDEAVIFATVLLMITDNVFLDVDAYKAHLEGLRKMLSATGDGVFSAYGGSLKSFVSWAVSNGLVLFGNTNQCPSFPQTSLILEYPTQPFSGSLEKALANLTTGFQHMASEGHLSTHVISILENTIRWTRCIRPDSATTVSDEDQAFLIDFDPRANAAMVMELCRTVDHEYHMERALCKALFIYHANILHWTCRCSGYKRIVRELADTVLSADPKKQWEVDFWSWMSLLITNSARRGSLPQLQAELMNRFFSWSGRNQDWDEVADKLGAFLYHSGLGGEWRLCWAAGLSHIVL